MGRIHLEDMEFYAYHGCFREEQVAGNRFLVNLMLDTDTEKASITDSISDALNYQLVYEVVKHEMSIKSILLEHVAQRIIDALFEHFAQLDGVTVKVSKMNPPIGGAMKYVSVELSKQR
jgi:7,8-dihydroneopterin aldolase/epimerase/oxygenase